MILGAVVAVFLLGIAACGAPGIPGGTVAESGRDISGTDAHAVSSPYLSRITFPMTPVGAWHAPALSGRSAGAPGSNPLIRAPLYVDRGVAVLDSDGDGVVAYDTGTGDEVWRDDELRCFPDFAHSGQLVCRSGDGELHLIDAATGASRRIAGNPEAAGVMRLLVGGFVHRGAVYLHGYPGEGDGYLLARRDIDGSGWSTGTIAASQTCPILGDPVPSATFNGSIGLDTGSAGAFVFDPDTLGILTTGANFSAVPGPDGPLFARPCTTPASGASGGPAGPGTLTALNGEVVGDYGSVILPSWQVSATPRDVAVADGDLVDLATGSVTAGVFPWAPDSSPGLSGLVVVGDTAVFTAPDARAGVDLVTGEVLWNGPVEDPGKPVGTDGRLLFFTTGQAIDLATGEVAWTLPVTGTGGGVGIAPDGLIVSDRAGVNFYRATGDPVTSLPGQGNIAVTGAGNADGAELSATSPGPPADVSTGGRGVLTDCGRVPELKAEALSLDGGILTADMFVKPTCPEGDVLAGRGFTIRLLTEGGTTVASGVFDLSASPVGIPASGRSVRFVFPEGSYWIAPGSLAGDRAAATGEVSGTVRLSGATLIVECERGDGGAERKTRPVEVDLSGSTEAGVARDNGLGAEEVVETACEALEEIRRRDRPIIEAELAGLWQPQLASMRPGTGGHDCDSILRAHLEFRDPYPTSRLVWSGDWRNYDRKDWWVTLSGVGFPTAEGALQWCRDQGFGHDDCYARLVSNDVGPEGTARYL
ncbi:outer membrane protein assembly factor BamB family protein [Corynebacterium sp. TAE3-ERU16]|uniref:outer membrane protein assembly factor BamB family protein n=1 Tax=Corynebacterium sp. TAE3-ERU16 TaxID=2849493 RepID=UPI001C48346E|nr:PQQ-binding-like beta-propeller repeat protein [Corynebacterium sp. TAE3-ERU16]MBV7293124.1 PQQ-like beta-propeller repeat protein [Corynebacterium sp. TAE3-ERU16]